MKLIVCTFFFLSFTCFASPKTDYAKEFPSEDQKHFKPDSKLHFPDWHEEQEIELHGKTYVYFNHPSRGFDDSEAAKTGIHNLHNWAKSKGIPTILTVDLESTGQENVANDFYLQSNDVTHTMETDGGSHLIHFTKAETIIFAGGHFNLCLCETVRDVVRYSGLVARPLNIVFVKDAVYDYDHHTPGMNSNKSKTSTLTKHFEHLGKKKKIADHFFQVFLGNMDNFCHLQPTSNKKNVDPKKFNIALFHNNQLIAYSRSSGPEIRFHFVDFSHLINLAI